MSKGGEKPRAGQEEKKEKEGRAGCLCARFDHSGGKKGGRADDSDWRGGGRLGIAEERGKGKEVGAGPGGKKGGGGELSSLS